MASLIRIENCRGGYRDLVDYVMTRGVPQRSRNGDTLEVTDMLIELAYPDKSIPCGINRKGYSHALAALEGLQLVAGETYDDLMVKIAPNTEQFREDDQMFHGGYGRRIGEQMEVIVERLQKDPDTRQAVVTLWNPGLDLEPGKKDYPCTCLFNWRVREGKLLMSTFMRSQDVHWGWPYDVVMFTTLHLTMASFLGVEPGPYTHHAASFHIYTKDTPALRTLQPWNGEDLRLGPINTEGCETWHEVMEQARTIVHGAIDDTAIAELGLTNAERWYFESMQKKLRSA